jgi:hypothetical protein
VPSVHHFFVSSLAVGQPLKKIEDQRFDYGIGHGFPTRAISSSILLENGFDFGVQGDVGLREAINAISGAGAVVSGGL